mmetsp:Transcript_22189/g.49661  ORF Transcript_22189/g.49661 Transcript_22189/m.49661 type:complete len:156 (-) Transcript_22189:9-476(-)
MVFIPGGVGYMGTDSPWMRLDGESPRRRVRLSPYYLDKYEVSNADFQSFVLETNFTTESELFGWSFVFAPAVPAPLLASIEQAVHGCAVVGACGPIELAIPGEAALRRAAGAGGGSGGSGAGEIGQQDGRVLARGVLPLPAGQSLSFDRSIFARL